MIVAEVTTRIRGIPQEVELGRREGLRRASVANLDNVHVIAMACIGDLIGTVRRVGLMDAPAVLDSDTLSELSRGHPAITARARDYLARHGRLTMTAVSVFERLRGYHAALKAGKPFESQLRQFEAFTTTCRVLSLDERSAERAARIWAALTPKRRRAIGDILIAAITSVHGLALVTRYRRDFAHIASLDFVDLTLVDWTRNR